MLSLRKIKLSVSVFLIAVGASAGIFSSKPDSPPLIGDFRTEDPDAFTIAVIPDPQLLALTRPLSYLKLGKWIKNSIEPYNIVAVTCVGDIVDSPVREQWLFAVDALKPLFKSDAVIALVPGNHDASGTNLTNKHFNTWFPPSLYTNKPWFGGSFSTPASLDCNFYKFTAAGQKYGIITVPYRGEGAMYLLEEEFVDWFNYTVNANQDTKFILLTHYLAKASGEVVGFQRRLYEQLVKPNSNVFLGLGGHVGTGMRDVPIERSGVSGKRGLIAGTNICNYLIQNFQFVESFPAIVRLITVYPSKNKAVVSHIDTDRNTRGNFLTPYWPTEFEFTWFEHPDFADIINSNSTDNVQFSVKDNRFVSFSTSRIPPTIPDLVYPSRLDHTPAVYDFSHALAWNWWTNTSLIFDVSIPNLEGEFRTWGTVPNTGEMDDKNRWPAIKDVLSEPAYFFDGGDYIQFPDVRLTNTTWSILCKWNRSIKSTATIFSGRWLNSSNYAKNGADMFVDNSSGITFQVVGSRTGSTPVLSVSGGVESGVTGVWQRSLFTFQTLDNFQNATLTMYLPDSGKTFTTNGVIDLVPPDVEQYPPVSIGRRGVSMTEALWQGAISYLILIPDQVLTKQDADEIFAQMDRKNDAVTTFEIMRQLSKPKTVNETP